MMQHLHMNPSETLASHNAVAAAMDGHKNNSQHSVDSQHGKKSQLPSQPPTPSVITPTRSFSSASLPGLLPTGAPRSPKSPQPPLHSSSQNSSPTPGSASSKRRVSESAKAPVSSGRTYSPFHCLLSDDELYVEQVKPTNIKTPFHYVLHTVDCMSSLNIIKNWCHSYLSTYSTYTTVR